MVRIEVLTLFRSGYTTFHPGEIRLVEPKDAADFCAAGWAKAAEFATPAPDTSPKVLDVHKSIIGQAAKTLGVN